MKNLRQVRLSRGLSQVQLADKAGMKQATISRIEQGVNNASLDAALRIAEALEVSPVELFGLSELEQQLLQSFREAPPERQLALLTLLGVDPK